MKIRKKFKAVYDQYQELNGLTFKVIRKITKPEKKYDSEVLPMYEIKIAGKRISAWPEEVELA